MQSAVGDTSCWPVQYKPRMLMVLKKRQDIKGKTAVLILDYDCHWRLSVTYFKNEIPKFLLELIRVCARWRSSLRKEKKKRKENESIVSVVSMKWSESLLILIRRKLNTFPVCWINAVFASKSVLSSLNQWDWNYSVEHVLKKKKVLILFNKKWNTPWLKGMISNEQDKAHYCHSGNFFWLFWQEDPIHSEIKVVIKSRQIKFPPSRAGKKSSILLERNINEQKLFISLSSYHTWILTFGSLASCLWSGCKSSATMT